MSSDVVLRLMGDLLWNSLLVAAPLLIVTLIVGVLISIIQVVTQVQEMSLTYVPKIIGAIVVLVSLGPWMLKRATSYAAQLIASIPQLI